MSAVTTTSLNADRIRFDYMNLLITQLRYQNPLEPMDNSDMAAQLAQLGQLEQLENLTTLAASGLDLMQGAGQSFDQALASARLAQAAALVGKQITFAVEGRMLPATGVVDRVEFEDGQLKLIVDDYRVDPADISAVTE